MAMTWDSPCSVSPEESYRQYAVRRKQEGASYNEIAREVDATWDAVRNLLRYPERHANMKPVVSGKTAGYTPLDPDGLWDRLIQMQTATEAYWAERETQTVTFDDGPVGIAFLSDQHLGGEADYRAMKRDAELVRDSGLYACLVGDVMNAWPASEKMVHLQAGEWCNWRESQVLFHDYLNILGDKLVAVVSGNHEGWLKRYGVDLTRAALKGSKSLYDPFEVSFTLNVGEADKRVCLRHKFKGRSILNPTHAIERSCRERETPFDVGIMGHTHEATIARPFLFQNRIRMAFLLSSYKLNDPYAREHGFGPSYGRGSGALILDEDGSMHGYGDLEEAARHLEAMQR